MREIVPKNLCLSDNWLWLAGGLYFLNSGRIILSEEVIFFRNKGHSIEGHDK